MDKQKMLEFISKYGYNFVSYEKDWHGYKCYVAYNKGDVRYVGLPFVVLVKDKEIRKATSSEVLQYLGLA